MNEDQIFQSQENDRKLREHIVSSTNILIFIFLLILVIITIWFLKHKKLIYIHETSLAIFYGAIFGAIIRYGIKNQKSISLSLTTNLTLNDINDLPDYVYLSLPNKTQKLVYVLKEQSSDENRYKHDFEDKAKFDPEIFFNLLLPPIIFYAGYGMKRKHFFKNFGAILLFSVLGTAISCFVIGGILYGIVLTISSIKEYFSFTDCLLFGALISATDPVTTLAIFADQNVDLDLYSLIFGESVLNDAVSIILAQQIERYGQVSSEKFDFPKFISSIGNFFLIFIGAFCIGSLMGCINALLTKFTYIRQHHLLETALFILMSYSTFLAAEAAGFTGIVAVLFCGIFQAHYTYNNLSNESQIQTRQIFHLLSFLSENFIFVYIGITMFTFRDHQWEFSFITASFFAIIVARALNIYPLSFLINLTRSKNRKIELNVQHLIFFSGLRGAMAFALAIRNTSTISRHLMLTTTSIIVIATVIFGGGFTKKMIEWLKIKSAIEEAKMDPNDQKKYKLNHEKKDGHFKAFILKYGLFKMWHGFDKSFMKPFLTHSKPTLIETLPKVLLPLAKILTSREQIDNSYLTSDHKSLINQDENEVTNNEANRQLRNELQMDEVLLD